MNGNEQDYNKSATKGDIEALRNFILERESAMTWKLLTLVLIIAAGQWAAVLTLVQHWKP